jgi:arylsulfatase A-like enzyme
MRIGRRCFIKDSIAAGVAWPSLSSLKTISGPRPGNLSNDRPNIVLILVDDQGWWEIGANGNKYIDTPVMDSLAHEGVRLTHFYVSPVCAPTRSSLMTGRHYQRTGAFDTYMGRDTLHWDEITIGRVLQEQGYRTGLVGKWALGRNMKYHPLNRGFDEFFGMWPDDEIHYYMDPCEMYERRAPVGTHGYAIDLQTDWAIYFIEANRNRPFFLYYPSSAIHVPIQVPDRYIEQYLRKGLPLRTAKFYGILSNLDENLGRLLDAIKRVGIDEKTIVIFTSDNGGVTRYFKAGLRGFKGDVYEGGIRVPFIARWPGHFPAGATVDAMAQHVDMFPTLCELTGTSLPTGRRIDGKSIVPLLMNGSGESPHDYLFHQWNRVYPIMKPLSSPPPSNLGPIDKKGFHLNWAIRNRQGYKLVTTSSSAVASPHTELFNLNTDPGESANISAEHPEIVKELRDRFEEWFADVTAGQDYIHHVPIEVGRSDENPVEFPDYVLWAYPIGKKLTLTYHGGTGDTIENWNEVGDYVRWKIDVVQSGQYEVALGYGCRPSDAGSRLRVQVGSSKVDYTVRATAGRFVFERRTVGILELSKGPAWFEIKPLSIVGKELFALHTVWLTRLPYKGDPSSSCRTKS